MASIACSTYHSKASKISHENLLHTAVFFSFALGSTFPCFSLIGLGYWYNFADGGENSFVVRNFINAAGYLSFALGAMEVSLQASIRSKVALEASDGLLSKKEYQWLFMLGGVIFITVHIQDIPDQEGDGARGRRTLPLVLGDRFARWSAGTMIIGWSFIAAKMWSLDITASVFPILLGVVVSLRLVGWGDNCSIEGNEQDKMTFKIWNLWIATLYFLPLVRL